ncbi:hypothetical protein FA13DRAFT_1815298, partial [Coprinellus micaceus]
MTKSCTVFPPRCPPIMSTSLSNVTAVGEVNQRIANTYADQSISTTTNAVRDVGHYSSFQINTQAVYTRNGAHQPTPGSPNAALKDLFSNISLAALHNASNRHDAPMCHEGTRSRPGRILRLEGPVGCGKSAILGTIADKLQKRGQLAAAFFFPSNTHSPQELCDKHRFVITLVYQLIQHEDMEFMRHQVLSTIEKDPTVFKMHLREQLGVLILRPLREQASQSHDNSPEVRHRRVVVVDGVYDCAPNPDRGDIFALPGRSGIRRSVEQDMAEILAVLQQAVGDPFFPFQILLSLRVSSNAMPHDTIISLSDKRYDPTADITLCLRHQFAAIRRRHSHLPTAWPGEEVIRELVRRASGLFIYIATVVCFVERPPKPPQVRLDIMLGKAKRTVVPIGASRALYAPKSHPGGVSLQFSAPLDSLYARLIWSSSNPLLVVRWLRAFQQLHITRGMATWFFHLVCESYEGEADLLFESTSGLVRTANLQNVDQAEYTFYHPSFQDFCSDYWEPMKIDDRGEYQAQEMWLVGQFILAFRNKGPQVPLASPLDLPLFCQTLIHFWLVLMQKRFPEGTQYYDEDLLECDPDWWLRFADLKHEDGRGFTRLLYKMAHAQCERGHPCRPECTRWRDPIRKLWQDVDPTQIVGPLADLDLPRDGPRVEQSPQLKLEHLPQIPDSEAEGDVFKFDSANPLVEDTPLTASPVPVPRQRKGSRLKRFVGRILSRAPGLWRDLVRGRAKSGTGHQ